MKKIIKKAVVTGASGFIGKSLVEYLARIGTEVTAVDILPFLKKGVCKSEVIDIAETGALDSLLDSNTVVFHMAARANVAASVKDPKSDFRDTLYGLFEVIESARKFKSRVIFPSTVSIFDSSGALPASERSFVKPISPYAAAKVAGEAYCSAYHKCYGLDVRVARMFSVYGTGMTRFAIYDIIQKIRKNHSEIEVLGDGKQIRDYLYIDDAIEGLVTIATAGQPGEDYNLASGIPVKISELTKTIASLMGYPHIKINFTGSSFAGDVPKWYADIHKIKKIGFCPKMSLEAGLKKTIKRMLAS